jgi:hypothetical protein
MIIKYRIRSIAIAALILTTAFMHVGLAAAEPPGADGNASFPDVSDSWSPDGRFVVKNVDTPENARAPHSIYLTDMQTGRRTILYSYARKADLSWSPASDALAINDWDANDDSQCIVFMLTPYRERIDLREELLKSQRPDGEKNLAADRRDYDRNYAHMVRWLDAKTLLFVVEGHSSNRKHNFELIYECQPGESFRLRKRVLS